MVSWNLRDIRTIVRIGRRTTQRLHLRRAALAIPFVATAAIGVAALLHVLARPIAAQHPGGGATRETRPPAEASQLNFLVGQWDISVKPKARTLGQRVHGVQSLQGTWKVWRALEGWGIEDEMRIVDAAGNPRTLSHAVRVFDAAKRTWSISMLDVYRGVFTTATGQMRGQTMHIDSQGTDEDGKPFKQRVTITLVSPTQLRYSQDRSADGGRTWDERTLVIEAKRSAAVAPR